MDSIVQEDGVTKLEIFKFISLSRTCFSGEYELHDKETSVPTPAMPMIHVNAPVMISSHAHALANDAANVEHMHSHANSLHSTATRESTGNPPGISLTITRGNPAGLQEATSAKRLSSWAAQGPPARSTGLTPDRQVDRFPQFEVCHNCRTQDSTVMSCRIDAQTDTNVDEIMQALRKHGQQCIHVWA